MDKIMEMLNQGNFIKELSEKFNLSENDVVSKLQSSAPELLGIFADGKVELQELQDAATKIFEEGGSAAGGILDKVKGFFGQ